MRMVEVFRIAGRVVETAEGAVVCPGGVNKGIPPLVVLGIEDVSAEMG